MATTDRRFHAGPFVLAALAAPASSFLIWAVYDLALHGIGPLDTISRLFGGFLFAVLVTGWGVLPAAGFGALLLFPLLRFAPGARSRIVFALAGAVAAALYALVALALTEAGQSWVFLIAPWVSVTAEGGEPLGAGKPIWPIVAAIILSGAVGGLVYASGPKPRTEP